MGKKKKRKQPSKKITAGKQILHKEDQKRNRIKAPEWHLSNGERQNQRIALSLKFTEIAENDE